METGNGCPSLLDFSVGKSLLGASRNILVYNKIDTPGTRYDKVSPRYNLFGAVTSNSGLGMRSGAVGAKLGMNSGRNNFRLHGLGLVNARTHVRKQQGGEG